MTTPTTGAAELPEALPRYREYTHLRTTGAWFSGVPAWARDYSGRMNYMTVAHAVIEELHAQVEALSAAQAGVPAEQTPELQRMTAHRAIYFMERFLKEEKLLGPNEQAALHFAIAMLAAAPQPSQSPAPADPDGEAFRTAARLGLTLRFYGGCAQSSIPGTPSAYEVVPGCDRAEAMRKAVAQAAEVIAAGGKAQECGNSPYDEGPFTLSAPAQPGQEGERVKLPDPDTSETAPWTGWKVKYHSPDQIIGYGNQQFSAGREFEAARRAARAAPQPASDRTVSHKAQAIPGVQWQCGQQANGFTAAPAAGVVRVCPECDIAGCRHMRTAPQPATADALDAMMLDALKHAQKVLNHHNLPLECGPINEAILAAHQGDTK